MNGWDTRKVIEQHWVGVELVQVSSNGGLEFLTDFTIIATIIIICFISFWLHAFCGHITYWLVWQYEYMFYATVWVFPKTILLLMLAFDYATLV